MAPTSTQASTPAKRVPLMRQAAVYATGAFSNSMANVVGVILPLWALQLDPSPETLGLVLASRHFLPLLFSIHGGALMDRLGTRRVMIALAMVGVVLPLFYPMSPTLMTILSLQMLTGFANSMAWVGAQSSVSQLLHGSTVYAGRFSFAQRIGLFLGPPAVGWAWDTIGPWGGFAFISLWASGVLFGALVMGVPAETEQRPRPSVTARSLLPRVSDYVSTLRLLAIPGMAIIIAISSIRIANVSIQDTFFVVLLGNKGFSATQIGLLISVASVTGAFMTLAAARACEYVSGYWIMIICVIGAVLSIAITPLLTTFMFVAIAAGVRGSLMGLSQPLVLTLLSDSVGRDAISRGFALRMTANRFASASVPLVMGAVTGFAGLEAAFYVMGAVLCLLTALVAIQLHHTHRSVA